MKKLILIIPFIFILFSCGENNSVSLNGGNGTGGDGSQSSVSGGDVTNPDGSGGTSGSGGTFVDVTDPEGGTGGDTTVVVDPGGDTGGGVIVDIDPGGDTGQVVIVHPDEEELKLIHNTIFDYINRDNLYYRSTLDANEKVIYDRLYDSFVSFYGRTDEEEEECTAGVLCHATDVFIETKCIDDKTGYELTNLSKEDREKCTPEEVKKQYDAWADANCIYSETGEPRTGSDGSPVCGEANYNYKYGEWLYREKAGVPVGLLDIAPVFVSFVFGNNPPRSPNQVLKSIEEKLMLDLNNLYLFKSAGQIGSTNDFSSYYKILTVSSFSSDSAIKDQWVSQMNQIQERVYYSIKNYNKPKFDYFEDLVYNYKSSSYTKKYNANGASDVTGMITGSFNGKGLARLFAFACQISSNFQCAYVEGKANYSDGFGNHGGQEFDHAWVRVRNDNIAPECSGAIIIDPLRFYEEQTLPYLCSTDAANAGYKPSVQ